MMRNFKVTLTYYTNKIKNWFLLDYQSFYLLSLLMYARRHWRVSTGIYDQIN
jgi:hypothetical protein